jgi:ABC-2 type transport system ATP-binding protein
VDLAERLQLDLGRRIAFMSTGMRQKLALAATFSAATPLLILDEPTSNLDPTMRQEIGYLVREAGAQGRTVVFSSHVLSEVEEICQRVAVMKRGRIRASFLVADIRKQHRIEGTVCGDMPNLAPGLAADVRITRSEGQRIMIEVRDSLPAVLAWIGRMEWKEIRVEPIGLRTVYDAIQAQDDNAKNSSDSMP